LGYILVRNIISHTVGWVASTSTFARKMNHLLNKIYTAILIAMPSSGLGSTIVFEHWMGPPPGETAIEQCDWDWQGWNYGPTDTVQYFTALESQNITGVGFVTLTPSETSQLNVSVYAVDPNGILGDAPLALINLSVDYFQSFGVEEEPVWGYAAFDTRPEVTAGEVYALRFESPSAFLLSSTSNPLAGGFLEGAPESDLSFRIYAVPEPSNLLLLTIALIGTATRRTR
jgi:hypothetical protein